jgi:hypothetical protein
LCAQQLESAVDAYFVPMNRTHVKQVSRNNLTIDESDSVVTVQRIRSRSFLKQIIGRLQDKFKHQIPAACVVHQMNLPYQKKHEFLWSLFDECENQCRVKDCQQKSFFAYLLSEDSIGEMRIMLSPMMRISLYKPKMRLFELLFLFPSLVNFWLGFSMRRAGRKVLTNKRVKLLFGDSSAVKDGVGNWNQVSSQLRLLYTVGWMGLFVAMNLHLYFVLNDYSQDNESVRQYMKRTSELNGPAVSVCFSLKGILKQVIVHQLTAIQKHLSTRTDEHRLPWSRDQKSREQIADPEKYVSELLSKVRSIEGRSDEDEQKIMQLLKWYQMPHLTYSYHELFDSVTFASYNQNTFTLWFRPEAYDKEFLSKNNRTITKHFELIFDPLTHQTKGSIESFRAKRAANQAFGRLNRMALNPNDKNWEFNQLLLNECFPKTEWNSTHFSMCGMKMTLFWYRQMVCVKTELDFKLKSFELQIKEKMLLDLKLNANLPVRTEELLDKRNTFGMTFVHGMGEFPAENWQSNLAGYSNLYLFHKFVMTYRDPMVHDCSETSRTNQMRKCFLDKFLNKYGSCSLIIPITAGTCPDHVHFNSSLQIDRHIQTLIEECIEQTKTRQCSQQYFKIKVQYELNSPEVNEANSSDMLKRAEQQSINDQISRSNENSSISNEQTRIQMTSKWIENMIDYYPKTQPFELLMTIGTVMSIWLNVGFLHIVQTLQLILKWLARTFCVLDHKQTAKINASLKAFPRQGFKTILDEKCDQMRCFHRLKPSSTILTVDELKRAKVWKRDVKAFELLGILSGDLVNASNRKSMTNETSYENVTNLRRNDARETAERLQSTERY